MDFLPRPPSVEKGEGGETNGRDERYSVMGYHPRIENAEAARLGTTRCRNSRLWFVNNRHLEFAILGYLAKYSERYALDLYAFAIEGNHLHSLAHFPRLNQSAFHRDLNSSVARVLPRYCPTYLGGTLWARRYSSEFVPASDDIEDRFFYVVLQPVQDGLVDKISEYPRYNCFNDAVSGITRKYEVINWALYNDHKRWNPSLSLINYKYTVSLSYKRLPGYENLSQQQYKALMLKKLEIKRIDAITKRKCAALGRNALLCTIPGSLPKNSKKSTLTSHRPRILAICPHRRQKWYDWYFDIYYSYKEASKLFRSGSFNVQFPPGTYRPYTSTAIIPTSQ